MTVSIWDTILNESAADTSAASSDRTLVLLGRESAGKSELISRLFPRSRAQADRKPTCLPLEYSFVDAVDLRFHIHQLSNAAFADQLRKQLSGVVQLTVLILLDLSRVGDIEADLNSWLSVAHRLESERKDKVQIMLVGTKSDMLPNIRFVKGRLALSFLHYTFRKHLLPCIFVSTATGRNMDVLYAHVVEGKHAPRNVEDMDGLYVPPGGDTATSVSRIPIEGLHNAPYAEVMSVQSSTAPQTEEAAVEYDAWDTFLLKHMSATVVKEDKTKDEGKKEEVKEEKEEEVVADVSKFFRGMLNRYSSTSNLKK
jgi:hypothetical protein